MTFQADVAGDAVHPASLQVGDHFVFAAYEGGDEYIVVRHTRGMCLGEPAGHLVYYLPVIILHQTRKGADVVLGNLRLLCCLEEDLTTHLVTVVNRTPLTRSSRPSP